MRLRFEDVPEEEIAEKAKPEVPVENFEDESSRLQEIKNKLLDYSKLDVNPPVRERLFTEIRNLVKKDEDSMIVNTLITELEKVIRKKEQKLKMQAAEYLTDVDGIGMRKTDILNSHKQLLNIKDYYTRKLKGLQQKKVINY